MKEAANLTGRAIKDGSRLLPKWWIWELRKSLFFSVQLINQKHPPKKTHLAQPEAKSELFSPTFSC